VTATLTEIQPGVIVRDMLTMQRATDLYLGDLARSGRRDRTCATYGRVLDTFIDSLPVDTDIGEVKPDDVRRFLDKQLRKSRGTQAQVYSILNGLFSWALRNEKIKRSPMALMLAPRRLPAESLDVVTLSTDDVRLLLAAARGWTEKLSVALPAYMGCRRRAAAQLRVKDYDRSNRTLRFQEKGGKTIWKPVPDELAEMLEARLREAAVGYPRGEVMTALVGQETGASPHHPDDYLIPNESGARKQERDDRVIWKAVKRAGERAGVDVHVHALRAAFAVFYLEQNAGDLEALQPLMGHASIATTQVYLRRLDRGTAMERVRTLSWVGEKPSDRPKVRSAHDIWRESKRPIHEESSQFAAEHVATLPREISDELKRERVGEAADE
jgi:integrase